MARIVFDLEKFSHPLGIEYACVYDGKILARVVPLRVNETKADRKVWSCQIDGKSIAVYTGKRGRELAVRCMRYHATRLLKRRAV